MNARHLLGSLIVIALLSGAVVAEAERNYHRVTAVEENTATVSSVTLVNEGLEVEVAVHNAMSEPLRVQYVHLELDRENHTDATSVPYNGYRSLLPGQSTLVMTVASRQLSGTVTEGETVTISGFVAVEVFNGYRFKITIEPTEVTV